MSAHETGTWAETRKWVQRNRALAASLAAAGVLLAAGLAVSLTQKARADDKALEAQTNLTLAQRSEAEAQAQRDIARAETAKVLRLSDVKVLQELERQADALWPAYPERIPALERWMARAQALAGNLAVHRATLAEMRAEARGWSEEERRRDRETHPRAGELREKQAELQGLIAQLDRGLAGQAQQTADRRVAELEPEVAALLEEIRARRSWSFDSTEDQWQHDVLAQLIEDLEVLESGLRADAAPPEDHGWSVPRRLAFARQLQTDFSEGGRYADAWSAALPAIRASYPDLDPRPQMGLVPIGPDPESGLWEFAHCMTGVPAERGADGELTLGEETGVVLVLLPGGTFGMGAQSRDPGGRNHDPQAVDSDGPVHEVELSPFFLSKYELTQGQWKRLTGRNPSSYGPDGRWGDEWLASRAPPSLLHPVEQVTWLDCVKWLPRAGLALPSEAQWEYGARAGTQTPFWSGPDLASLAGVANLSDAYGKRHGNEAWLVWEAGLDDGCTVHAAVGTFRANAFGLHEVAGNVWEWCLDGFEWDFYSRSPQRDPIAPWDGAASHVVRGGGFNNSAFGARSASRDNGGPAYANSRLGQRPALGISSP